MSDSRAAAGAPFAECLTFLTVDDLAATAAFYERALGLPLVLDQGRCRIYRVSASGYLGFCQRSTASPSGAERPAGVILTLATAEVDAWRDRLLARGVDFERAPAYNPGFDIYHGFLRDPDGYLIEIQAFCDPAWPGEARMPRPTDRIGAEAADASASASDAS